MSNMSKLVLGAAMLAGAVGLGATKAQAAEFRVYVGGPVAYVPPCPGPGYSWVAGYYNRGYWVPGRWNFVGYRSGYGYGYAHYDRDRDGRWDHDRDRDRHYDRDRGHDRDRDHFRR